MVAVAAIALAGSTGLPLLRSGAASASPAADRVALAGASDAPSAADLVSPSAVTATAPAPVTPTPDGRLSITNLEPPAQCAMGDVPTPLSSLDDWRLTLVDPYFKVPSTYVPDDLVPTSLAGLSAFFQVRSIMIPDLRRMAFAAAAAGAQFGIASAYRSYDTQVWTFSYWVNELGHDYAVLSSARAGHSEHQLGLAIDFEPRGGPFPWVYHNFAKETAAGQWLAANAWKYGFLMSYPYGSTAKSCYGFEPWHYRYVGVEEAALIHASRLTTREWMWQRQPNPESLSPMATPAFQYTFPAGGSAPTAASGVTPSPPKPTGAWPAP
jgi:D-alanyl-D-alanine carboxypeptidase